MTIYAESSAILAWIFGETAGESVRTALGEADLVVTSDLSLIECERALIRATTLGEISEAEATDRRAVLRSAARHWVTLALDDEIQARAKRPFPGEPIRTLDAIHIATLQAGLTAVPGLRMLSLDTRVRASAGELGVGVLPA